MQKNNSIFLILTILIVVILYPKFPLVPIAGSFVSVRIEDFVLAIISLIWLIWRIKNVKQLQILPVHRAILLYVAVGAVATFSGILLTYTSTLSQGMLHFLRRIEYVSAFFIAYDFLNSIDQLKLFVKSLLIVSLLVSIYGIGQQFLNFPVISTTNSEFSKGLALSLGPGARINSTFAGHYDLAAFSVFPLLLCLGLLLSPVKHKWAIVIIGATTYWTMLLSASRVTFAAVFITAAMMVVTLHKKWLLIPLTLLAIVSIIATPQLAGRYRELIMNHLSLSLAQPVYAQDNQIAVDKEVPDALKPPSQPEDRSLNIRLQAEWPKALRSLKKNPILGTGYSSVGLAVDNDYLRILAETGILGLMTFILIIKKVFANSEIFSLKSKNFEHIFILSISLGFVGIMLNGLFIDVFEASKIAIIMWLLLGLCEKVKSWQ